MKKKLINAPFIFLFFFTPELIIASEPYDFVSDVIRSLQQCNIAGDRINSSKSDDFVPLMKDFMVFKNEINLASTLISKYRGNKNEFIRESANNLNLIYSKVVDNNENLISFIEETLNNPSDVVSKQGSWLRKLSEIQAKNEELWRLLPYAVIMSTYSLLDLKKQENGHLCCLTITKKERDKLRSELVNVFGEQIKQKAKAGILPIEFSAASLWKFLAQEWKPSDFSVSE
jgi:hypothetical protein